ncbi:MAG: HK97 family phage prohead protease [Pseudomonadota bacterium]|nr:HK97 family phage prohead protease [Pseudomonadota bacterium]
MKHKHLDIPFEIKAVNDDGFFSGYGSVFEVLDSYREVVKPGAFLKSLADWQAKGKFPPVLWNHNSDKPIGIYTLMKEDERGLYVEGKLLVESVQQARETHACLKAGAISGMSIGYSVTKDETDGKSNVRRLLELKLYEVSIVTFPANEAATVNAVKSIEELQNLAEVEEYLRDAGGLSKKQAVTLVSRIKSIARSDSDSEAIDPVSQALTILIS